MQMSDLLDELERQSRADVARLERRGKLPVGFTMQHFGRPARAKDPADLLVICVVEYGRQEGERVFREAFERMTELEPERSLTVDEQRELRRLKTCAELATDVDTFVALCKGYPVPESRLNRRPIEQYDRMRARG